MSDVEQLRERVTVLETTQKTLLDKLGRIEKQTASIHEEITRWKGMWGGIMLVVSSVGAALYLFKDWLAHHIK